MSMDYYNKFYDIIKKEGETRMGISTQFAGSDDVVLLIVSDADTSGFGLTLRMSSINFKIGVFRTSHSKLLDKVSKSHANRVAVAAIESDVAQLRLQHAQIAKQRESVQIENDVMSRERLCNKQKIEELEAKIAQEKAEHELAYKERHEATRKILQEQLDKY